MMAGSVGLLGIQGTGIALWYALPDYAENIFVIKTIPDSLSHFAPVNVVSHTTKPQVRFWLNYSDSGLAAFHKKCPVRQTLYAWVGNNERFECPSCGSKFELGGSYIEGPARGNLDRFALKVITRNGTLKSNEAGDPIRVSLDTIEEVHVNVGKVIKSASRN